MNVELTTAATFVLPARSAMAPGIERDAERPGAADPADSHSGRCCRNWSKDMVPVAVPVLSSVKSFTFQEAGLK